MVGIARIFSLGDCTHSRSQDWNLKKEVPVWTVVTSNQIKSNQIIYYCKNNKINTKAKNGT